MQHYDVAIIGGGIGGLMSAYELLPQKRLGQGRSVRERTRHRKAGMPHRHRKKPLPVSNAPPAPLWRPCRSRCFPTENMSSPPSTAAGCRIFCLPNRFGLHRAGRRYFAALRRACRALHAQQRAEEKCLEYDLHMAQAQLKHLGNGRQFRDHAKKWRLFRKNM